MAEGFVKSDEHYADMISEATKASGVDMGKLLFEPNEDINITEFTQPALVTACCIITDALLLAGVKPDVTAGLSLGEYCSLYVAGAMSFEDAVRLTRIRGKLMSSEVPAGEGSMAAVIGLDADTIENTIKDISALAGMIAGLALCIPCGNSLKRFAYPLLLVSFSLMIADLIIQGSFGLNVFATRILTGAFCGISVSVTIDRWLRSFSESRP